MINNFGYFAYCCKLEEEFIKEHCKEFMIDTLKFHPAFVISSVSFNSKYISIYGTIGCDTMATTVTVENYIKFREQYE